MSWKGSGGGAPTLASLKAAVEARAARAAEGSEDTSDKKAPLGVLGLARPNQQTGGSVLGLARPGKAQSTSLDASSKGGKGYDSEYEPPSKMARFEEQSQEGSMAQYGSGQQTGPWEEPGNTWEQPGTTWAQSGASWDQSGSAGSGWEPGSAWEQPSSAWEHQGAASSGMPASFGGMKDKDGVPKGIAGMLANANAMGGQKREESSVPRGIAPMLANSKIANSRGSMGTPTMSSKGTDLMKAAFAAASEKLEVDERIYKAEKASGLIGVDFKALMAQHAASVAAQQAGQVAQVAVEQQAQMLADGSLDHRSALQIAASQAEQAQILQQHQFRLAASRYEKQSGSGSSRGLPMGRRPLHMCNQFKAYGVCKRGDGCGFAHSMDELHPASLELDPTVSALAEQDELAFINADPPMQMKKKRDMCHRMTGRGCLLNEKCMFAHSEDELGKIFLVITEERVKRVICKANQTPRGCLYGKYCINAHGQEEIGKMQPPDDRIEHGNKR